MKAYPCANSTCNNNVNKLGEYCDTCKRTNNMNRFIDVFYDPEHVKRQDQYRKHKNNPDHQKKDDV